MSDFKLPELGEGIEQGTVVSIMVSKGDRVEVDQPLMELETDKAVMEVPSSMAGSVEEILVKEGDEPKVGQVVFKIDESGKATDEDEGRKDQEEGADAAEDEGKEEKESAAEKEAATKEADDKAEAPSGGRRQGFEPVKSNLVPAAPSVRRLAREQGVDISQIQGSGPLGRISESDVISYAQGVRRPAAAGAPAPSLPDFSQWGQVETEKFSNVRRATAKAMANAWTQIPHVTQHDKADITDLEKLRKRYGGQAEKEGAKLTVTAILLKILAAALKEFPHFNVSIDPEEEVIYRKQYIHLGVAVDTPRGLLVPVIRDADQKGIIEIAVELGTMAEKAREGKVALEDMKGGCCTLTNLGGIGGTSFTPIVNWPEVCILGVSRGSKEAVWQDGQWVPRLMMPLSLSYDHRIIDGADAARFLRWICEALEEPFVLAL
ncbi:MAG TPA: 2-oxo acid dehydrogenase subunit E2 [Acidobacteriota bacterium]|nr:2-oxo acid dehydrogenase subunit E2 [Acidobacteriota bacterium]